MANIVAARPTTPTHAGAGSPHQGVKRMNATRLAAFALALAPLAPFTAPAWAADATPDQAQGLERGLRDWLATTLGPSAQIPTRIVQITAAGDHYDVAVPLGNTAD